MITNINLRNFRKFENLSLKINSSKIILTGKNAIGKTSVLESIYLASITKSHRTNNLKEIIKEDNQFADIKINYINDLYRVVLSKEGKMVSINNTEQSKISEYIGKFPCIFFSPNDLDIITGSPTKRRQFLNQEISQISLSYIRNLNLYNKLLQERNSCLKELDIDSDTKILDVITSQLIDVCKKIFIERTNFINKINSKINLIHNKINSNEKIELIYQPSVNLENIDEVFKSKKTTDIISKQTNYGIHRDELIFNINDKNAMRFASQGQIRNIILTVKLTLCEVIYEYKNKYPILLLDDVLSELDIKRQNNLLKIIDEFGQTFLICPCDAYLLAFLSLIKNTISSR